MNKKLVFNVLGRLLQSMSPMLLVPMIVSLIYRESSYLAFIITSAICLLVGTLLRATTHGYSKVLYAKEGFAIVTLAWLTMSFIGALPFYFSGEIKNFVDAFFESVSGYTTTGATILNDVESLSRGILFWRSFTHWIGGMGVLVFILAFVSNISDRSIHILRAEMPGPQVGKITPRSKDTSKALYIIYIALTVSQIILLWLGDMDLFESMVHSLATAGTGGFGIKNDGLASYSSYSQWIITLFMFLFGINFNLFYLCILKRFKTAIKSTELKVYALIIIVATVLISANIYSLYNSISEVIRMASFHVVSITTTTGFASADFNLWPALSKGIIFILLFSGACAGSTAGGLKISRTIIMFKMIRKEIRKLIHPRSISTVKFEDKEVEETVQHSVTTYFAVYMIFILVIFLLLSFEPFGFETNLSAAISCFNNVGPGFASVGPMENYASYSCFSKVLLSFAMLFGRLEIFPVLIALIPSTWKKQ